MRMARRGTVPMIDFNGFHFGRDQSADSPKTAVSGELAYFLLQLLSPVHNILQLNGMH